MSGTPRRSADIEREALRIMRSALDEPPERRDEFVRAACRGDEAVAARVTTLLASMDAADEFLDTPAVRHAALSGAHSALTIADHVERPHQGRVGHYLILRQIGAGGMGVVYLAEQESPRRPVALKMLRSGLASARARRLFEHEAQILGRLDHPNVARVFEASTFVDERQGTSIPFFAMEYIADAVPLTTYARTKGLDRAARIALFRKACLGVHHGHQKGIVHRDLKPANIVVDAKGEPRVIDYGVAIVTAGDPGTTFAHSDGGSLVGTLKYMSPEQCRGDARRVDTRSDVHALGVVLYELLCDCFPHDLDGLTPLEISRVITERPPLRPRLAAPDLPADLETIVLKAMAKAPDDRYQSVADLERDLGRFLQHEPIEARPFSAAYHARLFARRHRTLIAAGAFATLVAIVGTATSIAFAVNARNAERQATIERDSALDRQYLADMAAAESALRSNEFRRLRTHLDRAPPTRRGWEWDYLNVQADTSLVVIEHAAIVDTVVTLDDGEHFLVGVRTGEVERRRLDDGSIVDSVGTDPGPILGMALSPDGRAVAITTEVGHVECIEVPSLARRWRSERHHGDSSRDGDARALAWTADGSHVVSAGRDGTVRAWDALSGVQRWIGEPPGSDAGVGLMSIAAHPTEPIVVAGGNDGLLHRFDFSTGAHLGILGTHPDAQIVALAYLPDGTLHSGGNDRLIGVWRPDGSHRFLEGHDRSVWGLSFNADRTALASASIDHTVRVWSASDHSPMTVLHGHGDAVAAVAWSRDGTRLVSVSWDRTTRIWDAEYGRQTIAPRRPREAIDAIAVSGDVRSIATAHVGEPDDAPVLLRDGTTQAIRAEVRRRGTRSRTIDFSPDGRTLAIGWMDGVVTLVDADTGETRVTIEADDEPTHSVAFAPDGASLFSGHRGRKVHRWCATTATKLTTLQEAFGTRLVVSPDGRRLLTAAGREAQLWDLQREVLIATLDAHTETIFALAISPDGRRAFTGSRDQTIRVWCAESGADQATLDGHGQWVTGLAFLPDGSRLISGSRFETMTIWNAASLEPIVTLRGHDRPIRALAVDPRGDRILTADDMGTVRIWDRRPRSLRKESVLAHRVSGGRDREDARP